MLKSCSEADLRASPTDIEIPTLICHGTHDVFCAVEGARQLVAHIAHSTLELFEDSGHGCVSLRGVTFPIFSVMR
jgi:pimeloyl-ACP methyl ester carboxylesterase